MKGIIRYKTYISQGFQFYCRLYLLAESHAYNVHRKGTFPYSGKTPVPNAYAIPLLSAHA